MQVQTSNFYQRIFFAIVLAALFSFPTVLPAQQAPTPTPVTEVENADNEQVFISFEDGALLGLGEQGTGIIPAEGAGTRIMWYPAKAAFRAGQVTNTHWNADSVGFFSGALGIDPIASGRAAVAMGHSPSARGDYSIAMGFGTSASRDHSVAMGDRTTASGFGSLAFGNSTTAGGNYSTSFGRSTTASGLYSTAMGIQTSASGNSSTAMGFETTASGAQTTALGLRTTAASDHSLTIGEYNSANTSDDNTLFVVGNGNATTPSDALVFDDTGNMTITGNLTESSDRRLKKNIEPIIKGTLGKLSAITPSKFEFKNQQTHPDGRQIGLIAQEVQKEFPELINKNSKGYLSVSYSKFTAVLLKGMQEQQEKIERLEEKINRIDQLNAEVAQLKNQKKRAGLPLPTISILIGLIIGGGLVWQLRKTNQDK